MNSKYAVLFMACIISSPIWAAWPLVQREAESVLAKESKLARIVKNKKKTNLPQELKKTTLINDLQSGKLHARDFVSEFSNFSSVKEEVSECLEINSDDEYREEFCVEEILKENVLYLRAQKEIDDTAGLILIAHITKNQKQLNWLGARALDIPSYLHTLEGLERSLTRKEKKVEATLLSQRDQRRNVKPWGKIAPRQEIFLKYNFIEIKVLNEIMERTQKRIAAAKISILVEYENDGQIDETIEVPPAERYKFAQNKLKLELIEETKANGFLPNATVEGPHLIMASSELGFIDEGILKELINMPELKSKKSEKGKMYLNAIWSVGKAGLLAVPGGIYLALPIVIIESYFQGKKAQGAKNAPSLF